MKLRDPDFRLKNVDFITKQPAEMHNFDAYMATHSKDTVKKNLQTKRGNSINEAKKFCKSHPDAQNGKGEFVGKRKVGAKKLSTVAKAEGKLWTGEEGKEKEKEAEEKEDEDEEEEEEEDDDTPQNWAEWIAKWGEVLEDSTNESSVIFCLYALRDRTSEMIEPLSAP